MSVSTRERFENALDSLVDEIRLDDHILAAILCGSLSYDVVWEKSDIDLVLISADDKKSRQKSLCLVADDVNIHTIIQPRSEFKRQIDSSLRNSFAHSMFARSTLLFSHDPSIGDLLDQLDKLGSHDIQIQIMGAAQNTIATLYKAKKWHLVKDDLAYTAHWLILASVNLAEVVLSVAGQLTDRESLVRATQIEPTLFDKTYTKLFNNKISKKMLGDALDAIENYLEPRATVIFEPVIDYLQSAGGEPRSTTELTHYFERNYNLHNVVIACEWLSDLGTIEKASTPAKLTLYSQNQMDELAFFVV